MIKSPFTEKGERASEALALVHIGVYIGKYIPKLIISLLTVVLFNVTVYELINKIFI